MPKPPSFMQYQSPIAELSNRDLQIASWYVRHKIMLGKIGILMAFGIVLNVYALFHWAVYLFSGYQQDTRLLQASVASVQNYDAIKPLYEAPALQISPAAVLPSGPDRYDVVVDIANPSANHIVEVTYKFQYAGGETSEGSALILPRARRPVASLGNDLASFPSGVRFVILDMVWKKIPAHRIADPESYLVDRSIVFSDNFSFERKSLINNLPTNRITFDILNGSAYSFWHPSFYVELFDGAERVGILPFTLERFLAGDRQTVELASLIDNLNVTSISLTLLTNVFDPSEFMAPTGEEIKK